MSFGTSRLIRPALIAAAIGAAFGNASAAGLVFGTQSASNMGTANAGAAAVFDATTIFTNPAGMARLKGTHLSGALNLVFPDTEFTDTGSTTALGTPTPGRKKAEFGHTVVVPHLYATHELQSGLVAGLGVFVPYGSATDYDKDWTGRYHSTESELKSVNINPSIAWKPNEQWSLGAGLSAQFVKGKISKAIDFGSMTGLPAMSGNRALDGDVAVKGDDWGFGYNLGVMFEPTPATRFGLAYRSRIKHKVTGDADFTVPAALASNPRAAALRDTDASLDLTMPETFSIHGFHQIDSRWAVMGDITRTRHSRLQEIRIKLKNLPDSVTPTKWRDATRFAVGATYKYSDALTLRGGVAYDKSPEDDGNRIANIPDAHRTWLAGGVSWALDDKRVLDVALAYVKLKDGSVAQRDVAAPRSVVRGEYDTKSFVLGVQYNQGF